MINQQRLEIEAARQAVQARFDASTPLCYQRFAVNSCLSEQRNARREALADLRRQEIELNNQERRLQASLRARTVEQNLLELREREVSSQPMLAGSPTVPVSAANEKAPKPTKVHPPPRAPRSRHNAVDHSSVVVSAADLTTGPNAAPKVQILVKPVNTTARQLRHTQATQRAQRAVTRQAQLAENQQAAARRKQARQAAGRQPAASLPLPP